MQRWKYSCAKVLKRVIKFRPKRRIFRSCLLRQFLYIAFAKHMLSKPCLLLGKPPLGFDKSPPPFAKKRRVFCPKRGGCFFYQQTNSPKFGLRIRFCVLCIVHLKTLPLPKSTLTIYTLHTPKSNITPNNTYNIVSIHYYIYIYIMYRPQ